MTKVIEKSHIRIENVSESAVIKSLQDHVAKIAKHVNVYSGTTIDLKVTSHLEINENNTADLFIKATESKKNRK